MIAIGQYDMVQAKTVFTQREQTAMENRTFATFGVTAGAGAMGSPLTTPRATAKFALCLIRSARKAILAPIGKRSNPNQNQPLTICKAATVTKINVSAMPMQMAQSTHLSRFFKNRETEIPEAKKMITEPINVA